MTRTVLGLNNSGKWTFISYALTLAVAVGWAFAATAKTTTWSGGSSGKFSSADNWNNGAPGAGDTAVFTKAVSLESETVTLGEGTLTIDNAATLACGTVFAGPAALAICGAGKTEFKSAQTITGGATISAGCEAVGAK